MLKESQGENATHCTFFRADYFNYYQFNVFCLFKENPCGSLTCFNVRVLCLVQRFYHPTLAGTQSSASDWEASQPLDADTNRIAQVTVPEASAQKACLHVCARNPIYPKQLVKTILLRSVSSGLLWNFPVLIVTRATSLLYMFLFPRVSKSEDRTVLFHPRAPFASLSI